MCIILGFYSHRYSIKNLPNFGITSEGFCYELKLQILQFKFQWWTNNYRLLGTLLKNQTISVKFGSSESNLMLFNSKNINFTFSTDVGHPLTASRWLLCESFRHQAFTHKFKYRTIVYESHHEKILKFVYSLLDSNEKIRMLGNQMSINFAITTASSGHTLKIILFILYWYFSSN